MAPKRSVTPIHAMALDARGVPGTAGRFTGMGAGQRDAAAQMEAPVSVCRLLRGPRERLLSRRRPRRGDSRGRSATWMPPRRWRPARPTSACARRAFCSTGPTAAMSSCWRVVFQHSAAIILVPRRAGIATVSELKGRRLMDTPGSDDIAAMLKREGVDYAGLPRVPHNGDPRDLLEWQGGCHGRLQHERALCPGSARRAIPDLLAARLRHRLLRRQPLHVRAAGQDASRAGAGLHRRQPEGLAYALSHKEEIVDLILRRYSRQKSRDALLFEAIRTEALVQPDLIALGYQNQQHWKSIADTYRDLGMLSGGKRARMAGFSDR